LPETIAEDDDLVLAVYLFFGSENSTQDGLNLQYLKVTVAHAHTGDSLGIACAGHDRPVTLIGGNVFEDTVLATPIGDIGGGDLASIAAVLGSAAPRKHNAIWLGVRQRFQQDRVYDAEDRRVGADA